jgi:hypothetical protein
VQLTQSSVSSDLGKDEWRNNHFKKIFKKGKHFAVVRNV